MTEREWLQIFASNLQLLMDDFHITQRELAERTGLSEGTISSYVHGLKIPGTRAILKLAYAFNISIDELIDFDDTIE